MNGLTSHEWIRATIIADVFHWGMVGVLALLAYLVQRWLKRRAHERTLRREEYPGSFGPLPTAFHDTQPTCMCSTCGRLHYPMPSAEEQKKFWDMVGDAEARGDVIMSHGHIPRGPGPRIVSTPKKES